jgi:molybdate transport system ATP-binding protein
MKLLVDIQKQLKNHQLTIQFEIESTKLGILGASGCGKSMLLKCIAGIETPDTGRIQLGERILYDDKQGINLPPQKRKTGLLFQQYALFPHLTVTQNLQSVTQDQSFLVKLLRMFHLENVQQSYPAQLSGGQKQRAAFARMLAAKPELILLDEPFAALDTSLKEELQIELQKHLADFNGNVLIVSHSLDELYRLCPALIVVSEKECVFAQTDQLFQQPQTVTAAKLTGCKNILPIERIDAHTVRVLGWSQTLTVACEVQEKHRYIGIRAHDLLPNVSGVNQLAVEYLYAQQTPFEQNAWLNHEGTKLWWKGSKQLQIETVTEVAVLPEAIMALSE